MCWLLYLLGFAGVCFGFLDFKWFGCVVQFGFGWVVMLDFAYVLVVWVGWVWLLLFSGGWG